jgi:outer membrane immunogenic protein
MRRFVVAFLGAALSASAVNAADLGLRTPALVVPVATPAYNWSGCYLGAHAGGGWSRTDWINTASTAGFGDLLPGEGFRQTSGGFIGGGQVGCNYQVNTWVFGLEGSFSGSTFKGNAVNTVFGPPADDVFTTRVESLATVTGRVGYAWQNWLFYAKGGYAGGQVKFSVSDTIGPAVGAGSSSNWQNGWTAGGGVEYGLTPNWIVGVEYNYVDLLTKSYEVGGGAGLYTFDVHPRIHEILARISYKF